METLTEADTERFTLQTGQWYAAEIIGDEFGEELRSFSPLRIDAIASTGKGLRQFTLSFYHANYPEGVRDKVYTLRTIERTARYLLALSTTHNPSRVLLISDISWEWMRSHFRTDRPIDSQDIQRWLSTYV
jgi:hypothetical protein